MCKDCQDSRNEKFRARLHTDDESQYVDTEFTVGELEEALIQVTNKAILEKDLDSLKIASLFGFTTKKFEAEIKEKSMYKARFEGFREAIEEIKNLRAEKIQEAIEELLKKDTELGEIFSMLTKIL